MKVMVWPLSHEVPHWRSEARVACINAADAYTPSIRQRIDVTEIYAQALRALPDTIDGEPPMAVPVVCPITLEGIS